MLRLYNNSLRLTQARPFFNRFFGSAKCSTVDSVFRKFQLKCEDQMTALEATFKHASLQHLLQMLFKCQTIEIKDKFFYDSLLEQIQSQMGSIVKAKDMVLLGISLGTNKDFGKDHAELIKEFYAHVYKHRFMLSLEDKKALNSIFQQIGAVQLYRKHLDIFQEMPRKEVTHKTCQLMGIELPSDEYRIDFDHQNKVVILQNKSQGQSIIIYGSMHDQADSIQFGKQLIDTFKPQTILVEDGPLTSIKTQKYTDGEFIIPAEFDLAHSLYGDDFQNFVVRNVIENQEAYAVNTKLGIVEKRYVDGILEPTDFPSYAHYFHSKKLQTNTVDQAKLVFCDLSSEQITTSFLQSTPPERLQQITEEISFGVLFETASWLMANQRQGCVKCAPFLARQMLQSYPQRPIQLLSGEQIPSFFFREQHMAFNILKEAVNSDQKNFIAFVGRDHLLNVAKHLTLFVNNKQLFEDYQAPPMSLQDSELRESQQTRQQLMKSMALANVVYEDNVWAEQGEIPFVHTAEDLTVLKQSEKELQKRISLVDQFEDMPGLGLVLTDKDFISEQKLTASLAQNQVQDKEALLAYIKSEKGGGGVASCYPLSTVQASFAHYHLLK